MLSNRDLLDDATELPLPSLEALLAGTMALMTAWASPCPQARVEREALRRLLARKVQSNLFFLQHHPQVSAALGQVVQQMHPAWVALAGAAWQEGVAQATQPSVELQTVPPQHGSQPVVLH